MTDADWTLPVVKDDPALAQPCNTCMSTGWPPGCPPHSAGQHFSVWADSTHIGSVRGPAWQLVLSEPLPAGWRPPDDWRNVDSFIAAMPKGITVLWRKIQRPE